MNEIKVTLVLHDASKVRPKKTGWYLVHTAGDLWIDVMYSKTNDEFNSFDWSEKKDDPFHVDYWIERPDIAAITNEQRNPEPTETCSTEMHDVLTEVSDNPAKRMHQYSIDNEEPDYAEMD